jgi:hypothetical protein
MDIPFCNWMLLRHGSALHANTRFVDFWREFQNAPGYAKDKQPSCLAKFDNRI